MQRLWLALVLLFGFTASVPAIDLFVDNVGGDDLLDGTSQVRTPPYVGPTRTIAKALRVCQAGDRIILKKNAEPYHESISLVGGRHSGLTPIKPFIIQGNGATLDGSQPVPPYQWQHFHDDIFRFHSGRMTYQQLYLNGRPALRSPFDRIDGTLPKLEPLGWFLADQYIYFRVEKDKLPRNYTLTYTAQQTGITLYAVHDVAIVDLIVQGFQQDGICAHDTACDVFLAGLNCRGNGRSGIAVMNASRVDMSECVVGDNGVAQMWLEGFSTTHVSKCSILDNTAPPFVRKGGRLFVDGAEQVSPEAQAAK